MNDIIVHLLNITSVKIFMHINYKINNKVHKIIFCPDGEGLKIKKKENLICKFLKILKIYIMMEIYC